MIYITSKQNYLFSIAVLSWALTFGIFYELDQQLNKSVEASVPVEEVYYLIIEEEVLPVENQEPEKPQEPATIDDYVSQIAKMYNFDEAIIHSVIWHESRYIPDARNGSHLGLMQVSTKWHQQRAARLGVKDFYDPYGNILLGTDYLSEIYNQTNNMGLTLMTYNMGASAARKKFNKGELSWYATSVLERADKIRRGVI